MYQNAGENMKRTQRELLKMKKFAMKNTPDRINTKLDTTEKTNELKTQQKIEKKPGQSLSLSSGTVSSSPARV